MTKVNNNLSKEEIFSIAPELEVNSEDSKEEVLKETHESPISKRNDDDDDDDDANYIVPKMDLTLSLRDEENKEERIANYW
jgi:hypothetical protein